jgi:hypothetical protein
MLVLIGIGTLTLAVSVVVPLILFRKMNRKAREETSQLISRLDQHMGAAVKLIEVRDFYAETSRKYREMLEEAFKEGNRFRQDDIRQLQERLDTLKARTLDKQVRILSRDGGTSHRGRRRSSRRRKSKASRADGRSEKSRKGGSQDAANKRSRDKNTGATSS